MRRRAVVIAAAVALLVGGCSDDSPEVDSAHMETLRELYPSDSDGEIHELAESVCGMVESALDTGMSNAEAADQVFEVARGEGMSESQAMRFVAATVGGWCPMDISPN